MEYKTEPRYHYIYTLCIIIEGDFQDGDKYRNSSTMRLCLTRQFTYDGCPSGLHYELESFLDQEKNTAKLKKGIHEASIQIVNVKVIDQNKIPFTEKENEEMDREVEKMLEGLEA